MKNRYQLVSQDIIDTETGEILPISAVERLQAILVEKGSHTLGPKQIEYLKEHEKRYHDKTPYIWANFDYCNPYLPNVKDANIPRLIFFSTFCNDSGYVMCKDDVKGMLKINHNQTKDFYDNLTEEKIISIKDKKIYVSNTAFYKGTLLPNIDKDFTRVFLDTNRQLYVSCTSTQHKQLSYIYRMMPYVNRQTNILSYNQHEQDIKHIEQMTFKDFCIRAGYEVSHSSRLRKALLSFRISGELAVGFFDDLTKLTDNGKYVVVNPALFYGGSRETKTYKDICSLFRKEKKKQL